MCRQGMAHRVEVIDGEDCVLSGAGTGWEGVSFNDKATHNPYQARATIAGKQISLGYFATAEEGAVAVARARRKEKENPAIVQTEPASKRARRKDAVRVVTYVLAVRRNPSCLAPH